MMPNEAFGAPSYLCQPADQQKSDDGETEKADAHHERKRTKKKKRKLKKLLKTQEGKKKHKKHRSSEEHRKHKHRKHRKHKHKHHSSPSETSNIRCVLYVADLCYVKSHCLKPCDQLYFKDEDTETINR